MDKTLTLGMLPGMGLFGSTPQAWPIKPVAKAPLLNGPPLSVIVVSYDMTAQIQNTLQTLVAGYQQQVEPEQYQVVLIDNGSPKPLPQWIWGQAENIRYQHIPKEKASVNPGVAINWAVANNRSPMLCILIDGARLLTPGVLRWGMDLASLSQQTIVDVRSWDIAKPGSNASAEQDRLLLEQIEWPADPYRLFEIAIPSTDLPDAFTSPAMESNCIFLSRLLFDKIGGFDERYQTPGGGLCNSDFFYRAVQASRQVFTMLGEGTFHQFHSRSPARQISAQWKKEYEKLSRKWKPRPMKTQPLLAGHLPTGARRWLTPLAK